MTTDKNSMTYEEAQRMPCVKAARNKSKKSWLALQLEINRHQRELAYLREQWERDNAAYLSTLPWNQ